MNPSGNSRVTRKTDGRNEPASMEVGGREKQILRMKGTGAGAGSVGIPIDNNESNRGSSSTNPDFAPTEKLRFRQVTPSAPALPENNDQAAGSGQSEKLRFRPVTPSAPGLSQDELRRENKFAAKDAARNSSENAISNGVPNGVYDPATQGSAIGPATQGTIGLDIATPVGNSNLNSQNSNGSQNYQGELVDGEFQLLPEPDGEPCQEPEGEAPPIGGFASDRAVFR